MNAASSLYRSHADVSAGVVPAEFHRANMIRARSILDAYSAGETYCYWTNEQPGVVVHGGSPVDAESVAWAADYVAAFTVRVSA